MTNDRLSFRIIKCQVKDFTGGKMLEKYELIGKLYDYYGMLLNEKHKEILELYYIQDFSLSEIAEHLEITRQGVYDSLKRAEAHLIQFDEKMKLVEKHERLEIMVMDLYQEIENNPSLEHTILLKRLKRLIGKI